MQLFEIAYCSLLWVRLLKTGSPILGLGRWWTYFCFDVTWFFFMKLLHSALWVFDKWDNDLFKAGEEVMDSGRNPVIRRRETKGKLFAEWKPEGYIDFVARLCLKILQELIRWYLGWVDFFFKPN